MTTEDRRWFREWWDSHAFRLEVSPRGDLLIIPLPEPVEDYVDVPLGRVTWPTEVKQPTP